MTDKDKLIKVLQVMEEVGFDTEDVYGYYGLPLVIDGRPLEWTSPGPYSLTSLVATIKECLADKKLNDSTQDTQDSKGDKDGL